MVWLEVETKVRVGDVKGLQKRIREIANFEKRESRIDDYFALKRKFRKHAYPKKAFRIRKKSDGYEVNFKKWLKKYWDRDIVVKQEFEFALRNKGDVGDLIFLFKDLGFVQWMKKRKVSESYLHKKDKRIVIEINKVEHLGYFMEIEYLCEMDEVGKAKKKVRDTLRELGVGQKEIDNTGYTRMLWNEGIRDGK